MMRPAHHGMGLTVLDVAICAAQELGRRRSVDLFALAGKKNIFFYQTDSHLDIRFARDVFASDDELRAALGSGEPVALRTALVLLASLDPEAAGPLAADMLEAGPSEGLSVARYRALGLFDAFATIEPARLMPLLERPDMNAPAVVESLLRRHKTADARLGLLQSALRKPLSQVTWQLADQLREPLAAVARERLVQVLRMALGSTEAGWAAWAEETLCGLEDHDALRARAGRIDGNAPQPAIQASIALGPDFASENLGPRFFSKAALATAKGKKTALGILHSIETRIALKKDKRWKKHPAWLAIADGLAGESAPLGIAATSLADVLRGGKGGARPAGKLEGKKR